MKRLYRKLGIIILSVFTAACTCAAVSACSKKGNGANGDGGDGWVEAPPSSVAGTWDEYEGVKLAFADEEAYKDGELDESKILPELNCKLGEKYYMVLDFEIQADRDNDGGESVTACVDISPAAAVAATIQDTNSGKVSEETNDGVREIKATYNIPTKVNSPRNMRLVIQVEAKERSSVRVNIGFKGTGEMQGVKTAEIEKCAMVGYSENLSYEVSDGAYSVKGAEYSYEDIIIPSLYNGCYVTAISDKAFFGKSVSVTVPDSIARVGAEAFYNCDLHVYEVDGFFYVGNAANNCVILTGVADGSATDLKLSEKTNVIYDNACNGSNLQSVDISNGVTCIGDSAFYGCDNLLSVSVPDSIKYFGDYVFDSCEALQYYEENGLKYLGNDSNKCVILVDGKNGSVSNISDKIKIIYGNAFAYSGLSKFDMPNEVVAVGKNAFKNCEKLEEINISKNVKRISDNAFEGCKILKSVEVNAGNSVYRSEKGCLLSKDGRSLLAGSSDGEIPSRVIVIDDYAYSGRSALKEITIPKNVTRIGYQAFKACVSLTGITLPDGLKSIGEYAFSGCNKIKKITIPKNVAEIGGYAFYECSSLESISVESGNSKYVSLNGILYDSAKTSIVQIPKAIKGSVTLPDGITSIRSSAFSDCKGLTSITIPNGVTSIENSAFSNCQGLTKITIPNGVTSIGSSAFSSCQNLTSITLPDSLTSIGSNAFYHCTGLTSISIPNNVTSIADYAFYQCSGLTSITVGSKNANYKSEKNCLLSKDGKTLLLGCKKSTIPSSVTTIAENAFNSCSGLTTISIPNSVTSIGSYAFLNCGLTSVTLPNKLTTIEYSVFFGCEKLSSVIVPTSVKYIKGSAFSCCYNLGTITYKGTKAQWKSIYKVSDWNNQTSYKNYVVKCTDGSMTSKDM